MLHSRLGEGAAGGSVPETLRQIVESEYERLLWEKEEKCIEEEYQAWSQNLEVIRDQITEEDQRLREAVRDAEPQDISIPATSSPVGKTKKRTIITKVSPVASTPPVFTWTAVRKNIMVDDETALHNYPNIANGEDEEFNEDLLEAYEGKLHAAEDERDSDSMDDEVLVELVKSVLHRNETRDGENAEAQTFASSVSVGVGKVPPISVFQAISEVYPDKGSTEELKERYANVIGKNEQEARAVESRIPNIDIDKPGTKPLPRDEILSSYRSLFCRRCFTYDCLLHTLTEDQLPYAPAREEKFDEFTFTPTKPCGKKCFLHLKQKQAEIDAGPWSEPEHSLFTVTNPMYKSNYCAIATMIKSKTCQEVYYFAKKEAANKPGEGVSVKKPRLKLYEPKEKSLKKVLHNLRKHTKKTDQLKEKNDSGENEEATRYTPCDHPGQACKENCPCFTGKNFCEKFCRCAPGCVNSFPGCRCKKSCNTRHCPCYVALRECDPDVCKNCSSDEHDISRINCRNVSIQRGLHKHLLCAKSDVAGWGIFVKDGAQKNEFIAEYTGEVITQAEADRRGKLYDRNKSSFLFNLNSEFVVDSTNKGSKIRFVNHSNHPNCYARVLMVNGDHRIGIFARRDIKDGEELLLDYQYGPTERLKYVGAWRN